MREIKFRLWSESEKQFFFWAAVKLDGSLLDGQPLEGAAIMLKPVDGGSNAYGVREVIEDLVTVPPKVQQYTGLKDKNGKEIYEGDIIDNHEEDNNKKVVNYDPHSCYFCLMDFDEWPDKLYNGEMFNQAGEGSNFSGRIEVIGNIFEGVDK